MTIDINNYIGKTFVSPTGLKMYVFHMTTNIGTTSPLYKHTMFAHIGNGSIYQDYISDSRLKSFKRTKDRDETGRILAFKRLFDVTFNRNYEKDKDVAFSEHRAIELMIHSMRRR